MGDQTATSGSEDPTNDHVYMMLWTVQPEVEYVLESVPDLAC
jgi:hypothetical protein